MNTQNYPLKKLYLLALASVCAYPQLTMGSIFVVHEPISKDYTLYYIIGSAVLLFSIFVLYKKRKHNIARHHSILSVFKKRKYNIAFLHSIFRVFIKRKHVIALILEPISDSTLIFTGTRPSGAAVSFTAHTSNLLMVKAQTIGREDSNDHAIIDYSVSRFHAEIRAKNGHIWIGDLGSKNGTFLNGKRLKTKEFFKLKSGDKLQIGKVEGKVNIQN